MCQDLRPFEIIKTIADFAAPVITIGAGLLGLFTETKEEKVRLINGEEVKEKVLSKWAWFAMTGILIGGIISIISLINDRKIESIHQCIVDNERSNREREKFIQDSTYKANTDTIISKSNQLTINLLKSISLTETTSNNLNKFQSNQSQANEVADYSWFINLASDIYVALQSSTFLLERDIKDSANTVSSKFATMVLDIDAKMKAGLKSPFLDRHKKLKEGWKEQSEKMNLLANAMPTLGQMAIITQNEWFDNIKSWGEYYDILYLVIPEFRIEEITNNTPKTK